MKTIGAPGSPQPGKSLPMSQPPIPSKGDSMPDGRGTNAKPMPLMESPRGPSTVSGPLHSAFRQGLISGGKGQSVGDMVGPMGQNPGGKKAPLGSGDRFAALKAKLGKEKGVTDPAALAASIGRKKYGAGKMAAMSAAGRKKGK